MILLLACWQRGLADSLNDAPRYTGAALLLATLLLACYGPLKRLPFFAGLGPHSAWLQLHLYLGVVATALFFLHVGWRIPSGVLERLLAAAFLAVAASGAYGWYASRTIPRRLTAVGDEVVYEQIPLMRRRIALEARRLALEAQTPSSLLATLYAGRLAEFFERPRGVRYLLQPSRRQCRQLLDEIETLDRYLDDRQRRAGRALAELVEYKDRIDYHQALQGRLKWWLIAHTTLGGTLLILALTHAVLAMAFRGGTP